MLATPFLFGTVGASVEFNKISSDIVFKALAVILVSLVFRCGATYLAT